jgi:hypothetical protein
MPRKLASKGQNKFLGKTRGELTESLPPLNAVGMMISGAYLPPKADF